MLSLLGIASLLIWLAVLLLPWQAWRIREFFNADQSVNKSVANRRQNVSVLIPARNEAERIQATLESLRDQSPVKRIILINDQSTDNTAEIAHSLNIPQLDIIDGTALEEGWSGKLWALQQGLEHVDSEWVLLLDADIALLSGTVESLLEKAEQNDLGLVSLMAKLRMISFWEKLLIPSFIYFFKLLYPFRLSNQGSSQVAAAAGGCILVKKSALDQIGGFTTLKDALIDDCSLAKAMRKQSVRTWIGLTHSAISHRPYDSLTEIWNMVARTAYSQLKFSPILLLICTVLMLVSYIYPIVLISNSSWLGWVIFTLMLISFIPTIKYYKLHPIWLLGLPLSGFLYLCMTWSSAIRYYRGQRSQWKGRVYSTK